MLSPTHAILIVSVEVFLLIDLKEEYAAIADAATRKIIAIVVSFKVFLFVRYPSLRLASLGMVLFSV
jgi:hypothetical protein